MSPKYWHLGIGIVLMLSVFVIRNGIAGVLDVSSSAMWSKIVTAAIETVGLTVCFGHFTAVDDVTLSIAQGARHALIGPNGAGKTTLVHALTGSIMPTAGRVIASLARMSVICRAERPGEGRAFYEHSRSISSFKA